MNTKLFINVLIFFYILSNHHFVTSSVTTSQDPVAQILTNLYNSRAYDPTQSIAPADIDLLIQAAQSTPSSYNEQPWHFIFCDRDKDTQIYHAVLNALDSSNQEWALNAPMFIIVIASLFYSYNHEPNPFAHYDTGAAAFAMILQAASRGLMAHPIGGFDPEKIRCTFNISALYQPLTILALGYVTEKRTLAKKRKPLNQNFFFGTFISNN